MKDGFSRKITWCLISSPIPLTFKWRYFQSTPSLLETSTIVIWGKKSHSISFFSSFPLCVSTSNKRKKEAVSNFNHSKIAKTWYKWQKWEEIRTLDIAAGFALGAQARKLAPDWDLAGGYSYASGSWIQSRLYAVLCGYARLSFHYLVATCKRVASES